jgi:hypothetical protein
MEVVSTHVVMDIMKMMIPDHVKSVVTNVSHVTDLKTVIVILVRLVTDTYKIIIV